MPSPAPNFASPAFREAAAASMGPIAARVAEWYSNLPAEKKVRGQASALRSILH